jgi:hypothetical protein
MKNSNQHLRRLLLLLLLALAALTASLPVTAALETAVADPASEETASESTVNLDQDSIMPETLAESQAASPEDSSLEEQDDDPGLIDSLRRKIRIARALLNALLKLIDHELGRLAETSTGL